MIRLLQGCGLFLMLVFTYSCMAQTELSGQFRQGGLVVGKVKPGTQVLFNERTLAVSEQGYFVLGFDRDADDGDQLVTIDPEGKRHEQLLKVVKRSYNIQRIDGISKKMMAPSEEDLKRIGQENRLIAEARKQHHQRSYFAQSFQWPANGPITGVFGSQRVYNGEPRRPHYGVDVAGDIGTLVTAPAAGVVTLAHDDMFYSGGTLIIDHGHRLSSSFLHLSEILVKAGDEVEQGEPIARIGNSGRVTGAHLDWRMNWFDRRLDPQLLVPPMTTERKPIEK